jgi:hypothetical protein
MRSRFALFALAFAFASCRPNLGDRDSLVTRTEILAVRGEPAEVEPGATAQYTLLVATPDGPAPAPLADWAFCTTPKLLTENGVASAACLGTGVRPIATGSPSISAATPADACSLFGPEVASADLRPRDPDVTGGFYQPVRAAVAGDVAFGLERLGCKLANASADVAAEYAKRHHPNVNPELLPLAATIAGAPVALDALPRGATVTFRASWPEPAAEQYVVYDRASGSLVDHRETMRVSWFATAGTFDSDRTGRSEAEPESFTDNAWTAPDDPRTTHLFVVLRDARGGTAFATYELVTR